MELVSGGELFDRIVRSKRFSEDVARAFFQQLLFALVYCHSRRVAHRDLKPENILVADGDVIKISDFGMSAFVKDGTGGDTLLQTTCGTPAYVAPEVIQGKGYDGMAADVWSCGVILYVMMVGHLPFDSSELSMLLTLIERADFVIPSHVSPDASALLRTMLVADPLARASLTDITDCVWFQHNLPASITEGLHAIRTGVPSSAEHAPPAPSAAQPDATATAGADDDHAAAAAGGATDRDSVGGDHDSGDPSSPTGPFVVGATGAVAAARDSGAMIFAKGETTDVGSTALRADSMSSVPNGGSRDLSPNVGAAIAAAHAEANAIGSFGSVSVIGAPPVALPPLPAPTTTGTAHVTAIDAASQPYSTAWLRPGALAPLDCVQPAVLVDVEVASPDALSTLAASPPAGMPSLAQPTAAGAVAFAPEPAVDALRLLSALWGSPAPEACRVVATIGLLPAVAATARLLRTGGAVVTMINGVAAPSGGYASDSAVTTAAGDAVRRSASADPKAPAPSIVLRAMMRGQALSVLSVTLQASVVRELTSVEFLLLSGDAAVVASLAASARKALSDIEVSDV